MNRKIIISCILFFFCAGNGYTDTNNPRDRDAILATNVAFEDAWSAGDAAGVAALYTDDAIFLPPGAPPFVIQGRAAIEDAIGGVIGSGVDQIILETEELEIYRSRRAAYELGVFTLLAGGTAVDCGPYMVIWKQEKKTWRLHRDIFNSSGDPSLCSSDE